MKNNDKNTIINQNIANNNQEKSGEKIDIDAKKNNQNQVANDKNKEDNTRYGDWVIKGHAIDF